MASHILNWKEIDLVLGELSLDGSIISQAYQPRHEIIIFELFRDRHLSSLLFSFSPVFGRLHKTVRKYSNPKKPQRFVSFLRARLRGGRITDVCQLNRDRIIKMTVKTKEENLIVWVRLWGGASNMIVTDDAGNVLDACYRRPKKNEVSGGFYDPEKTPANPAGKERDKERYSVRELEPGPSFNGRLDDHFRRLEENYEKESVLTALTTMAAERENYLRSSIERAVNQREDYKKAERYKELGDIIMSVAHTNLRGEKWLTANDFYNGNAPVEIELDPAVSLAENAGSYYDRFKKAKGGLARLEENLSEFERALESLEKKRSILSPETPLEGLKEYARELKKKERRTIHQEAGHGLTFAISGYEMFVGRTAAENDHLLRRIVRGNDYWFHCRDYPGAYVFVKSIAGKSLPLDVMVDAGNLALFYSKAKQSGRGDVYYTCVKYLRRVKDGKKGLVIPTQEKNLHIVLDEDRVEKLKNL